MGFLDLFKKKENDSKPADTPKCATKEEIYRAFFQQRSPSEQFASGAAFDISRQNRDIFLKVVSSIDAISLHVLFAKSYSLFLDNPEVVGFTSAMVNKNNNDTNPNTWNADIFTLKPGDYAALLFMPIQNDTIVARITGIVFSQTGDGYYYCMLNKDEGKVSSVYRNRAMLGIDKVGEVSGLGFELMNSFLNCIKLDYYQSLELIP